MDENKRIIILGIGFIVLLAVIVGIYYFFIRDTGEQPPVETQVAADVSAEVGPEEVKQEPGEGEEMIPVDLDESDGLVRDLAEKLSYHPDLAQWLLTDDLIRKFVAAVDNIANGVSPRKHVDFFTPEGEFKAGEKNGRYIADPASYARYSPVAGVFSSLNAQECVSLYRKLYPTIQQAYRDLGYPGGNFNKTLLQALQELLGVPIIEGDILLEAKLLSFELAVPELENLSQAQKHLFRMGPQNIRIIQTKLRELKSLLSTR